MRRVFFSRERKKDALSSPLALCPLCLCGESSSFFHFVKKLLVVPILLLLLSAQKLPEGFAYKHRVLPGPVSVHILEVDPAYARIAPAHAAPYVLSVETTSSIATRQGAFAAVNGGFFRMEGKHAGSSSGILKIAREFLSSPRLKRAAIGWSQGGKNVLIDRVDLKAEMKWQGDSFPIDGINQPYAQDKAILYTPNFYSSTLSPPGAREVVVGQNGRVQSVDTTGDAVFSEGGYIYTIGEKLELTLPQKQIGSQTSLSFDLLPQLEPATKALWNRMDEIVGGTPLLIHKRKKISDFTVEKVRTSFLEGRHPRTAVGIKPSGHWVFVVVDGRQPNCSIGMTMEELCDFLFSLGCSEALNLDGGGSSTLFLNGKVVNSISCDDGQEGSGEERAVSDAILIWKCNE